MIDPSRGEGGFQARMPAAGSFGPHFYQAWIDQQPDGADHAAAGLEGNNGTTVRHVSNAEVGVWRVWLSFHRGVRQAQ